MAHRRPMRSVMGYTRKQPKIGAGWENGDAIGVDIYCLSLGIAKNGSRMLTK